MRAVPLQQQREIERCINVVGCNQQRLAQAFDSRLGASLIIQQVGEIVPSFGKCRIGASSRSQSRFGFDGPARSPKHVPEIERRRCISRIAFHKNSIEPLGFGYVTDLFRSVGPIEQFIRIIPGVIYRQDELTIFVGAAARLLDLNVTQGASMQPDLRPIRQLEAISGFR